MKKETLINFQPTFAATAAFFDEWNKDFERKSDPRRLKQPTKHIAEACIRLYGRQLSKAGKLLIDPSEHAHALDYAPDFSTNCHIIAKEVNCSKRTAYTHIKKLLDADFFTNKRHHGPVQNFDLRFNKKILSVRCLDDLEDAKRELAELIDQAKAETGIRGFQSHDVQNSRQCYSSRDIISLNNTGVDSDKRSNSNEFGTELETNGNSNGDKGKEGQKKLDGQETNEFISPELAKKLEQEAAAPKKPKKPKQLEKNIQEFAMELWFVAAKLIWFNWEFGPKQLEAFKTMLLPYFEPAQTTAEAKKYFKIYAARLKIAANYYKKHPEFDKVHPFTYFDPEFKYGFRKTQDWYINQRKAEWEKIKSMALRKALKHCEKNKTVAAYQAVKKELQRFKDPQLLNRFHAAMAEQKTAAEKLNNYKNLNIKWHSTTKTAATKH